jgi:hypothetical protein
VGYCKGDRGEKNRRKKDKKAEIVFMNVLRERERGKKQQQEGENKRERHIRWRAENEK